MKTGNYKPSKSLIKLFNELKAEKKMDFDEYMSLFDNVCKRVEYKYLVYISGLMDDNQLRTLSIKEYLNLLDDIIVSIMHNSRDIDVTVDCSIIEKKFLKQMLIELREYLFIELRNNVVSLSNTDGRIIALKYIKADMLESYALECASSKKGN